MYIPSYFQNTNYEEITAFLQANSFGILVTKIDSLLEATHIPFHITTNAANELKLTAHIARKNNQLQAVLNQENVLCIFQGPHAYVSSSWYSTVNVPTWNYVAVHVQGRLRELSREETKDLLAQMVEKYEHGRENRFHLSSISNEMYDAYLKEIVAFEVTVEKILAKNKLSQNRTEVDKQQITTHLSNENDVGAREIANLMQRKSKWQK
ncbi:MAG: FMN-binding negative transcriptional regulator [Bacteroidetes bacterium]|nr:FMN-binding negative transcriptional regulator [Bacteroidota bacterium]